MKRINPGLALGGCLLVGLGCCSMASGPAGRGANIPQEDGATAVSTPPNSRRMPMNDKFASNLPEGFVQPTDPAGSLLLKEYGAVFVARGGVTPPPRVVFKDEAEVTAFQAAAGYSSATVGGVRVDLQTPAINALEAAIVEARAMRLSISPRGADSARRSYSHTVTLWASRVEPGLRYWSGKGRITAADARRIRALSPFEQVPEILRLERDGIYFAKSLDKSIIYSVAPPGTSQHLSMLALDVKEFENARVRSVLAKHGWFQTVVSDLPHFTYLGVPEDKLPALGLKKVESSGRDFWVPDI